MGNERPDYMPPWMNWPRNRRLWGLSPRVVIGWFVLMGAFGFGLLVAGAAGGEWGSLAAGASCVGFVIWQGQIYVPRAWRAARRQSSN